MLLAAELSYGSPLLFFVELFLTMLIHMLVKRCRRRAGIAVKRVRSHLQLVLTIMLWTMQFSYRKYIQAFLGLFLFSYTQVASSPIAAVSR